jgi:hypothetical protein
MTQEVIHHESVESLEDSGREWSRLTGGTFSEVWRSGDTVKRARVPPSDAVVQLLTCLTERGVPAAPEFVAMSEQNAPANSAHAKIIAVSI